MDRACEVGDEPLGDRMHAGQMRLGVAEQGGGVLPRLGHIIRTFPAQGLDPVPLHFQVEQDSVGLRPEAEGLQGE